MENKEWLVEELMQRVHVKSQAAFDEISDLLEACLMDLEIAGVYVANVHDPLFKQAAKLYCKANYGYDEDSEKFRAAYASLKDAMALSGDYKKGDGADG